MKIPYITHQIGEKYYPSFEIWYQERPSSNLNSTLDEEMYEDRGIAFGWDYPVVKTYSENYISRWQSDQSYGHKNRTFTYGGTHKTILITFDLPAGNWDHARDNLQTIDRLSMSVYGHYEEFDSLWAGKSIKRKRLLGSKLYLISFGNLINNELCYINNFSWSPVVDAGIYEPDIYETDEGAQEEVPPGILYPRNIRCTMDIAVVFKDPVGWGGDKRPDRSIHWAANNNKDWPHYVGISGDLPAQAQEFARLGLGPEELAAPPWVRGEGQLEHDAVMAKPTPTSDDFAASFGEKQEGVLNFDNQPEAMRTWDADWAQYKNRQLGKKQDITAEQRRELYSRQGVSFEDRIDDIIAESWED
tara:strand:- start:321 stop:1397 length:1077 start_codon:yes stop_codon:yes gene_type:complete